MSCFDSDKTFIREQRRRSEDIDLGLLRDLEIFRSTRRVLFLGASMSGKTTIIRQMKIYHGGYSKQELNKMAEDVRATVKHIIETVITQMDQFDPPILLANDENIPKLQYIQEHIFTMPEHDTNFPEIFYEYCDALWQDNGVKQCFARSAEYQLIDSAGYFMESSKLSQVAQKDYIPSNDDILKQLYKKEGVYVTKLTTANRVNFQLLDVGKQKIDKRKWMRCFNDVTSIVFVVDISCYDVIGTDDKNQLSESLAFFESIINDRDLQTIPLILFFNKMDIFRSKIDDAKIPLQAYFPEFKTYTPPYSDDESESNEVTKAKFFVKDLFLGVFDSLYPHAYGSTTRYCYPHFTEANDFENIKRIV